MHTMPSLPPEKHEASRLACLAEEARLVAVAAPEVEVPAPEVAEPQEPQNGGGNRAYLASTPWDTLLLALVGKV